MVDSNVPERLARIATVPKHGCLPVLGIREKSGRFNYDSTELTGRREKSRKIFLVLNNVRETRRKCFHD
jgi:hypothetical protein